MVAKREPGKHCMRMLSIAHTPPVFKASWKLAMHERLLSVELLVSIAATVQVAYLYPYHHQVHMIVKAFLKVKERIFYYG